MGRQRPARALEDVTNMLTNEVVPLPFDRLPDWMEGPCQTPTLLTSPEGCHVGKHHFRFKVDREINDGKLP